MGTFAKLVVCFGIYFFGFIGSNIYREFQHMQPSQATSTQIGFLLAIVCWFLIPRKQ
jgi:hypothetical protein